MGLQEFFKLTLIGRKKQGHQVAWENVVENGHCILTKDNSWEIHNKKKTKKHPAVHYKWEGWITKRKHNKKQKLNTKGERGKLLGSSYLCGTQVAEKNKRDYLITKKEKWKPININIMKIYFRLTFLTKKNWLLSTTKKWNCKKQQKLIIWSFNF